MFRTHISVIKIIPRYTLQPNDTPGSSSRRTYTLRSSSPSNPATNSTDNTRSKAPLPTETVLATVLDEADIVFSNIGFRYRVKTLDDDNDDEDTIMKDTDIGVGDMSDVRRVLRWQYAVDPEIVRKTAARGKAPRNLLFSVAAS